MASLEEDTDAPTSLPDESVVTEEDETDDFYIEGEPEKEESETDDFYIESEQKKEEKEEEEEEEEEELDDLTEEPTEEETPPDTVGKEDEGQETTEESPSSTDGSFGETSEETTVITDSGSNETAVFPPRDGSASMIISTQGGYVGSGAHGRKYQILYCIAAACFIVVGILDSQREKLGYHAMMMLAGLFGMLSGGLIRENEYVSSICHSLSVHFFLVQALLVIYNRLPVTWDPVIRKVLWVADILFTVSALLNIVLSYLYYKDTEDMSVAMATTAVISAVFWCHTAIIYLAVTVLFWKKSQKTEGNDKMEEDSVQNSCSVVPNGDGEMDVVYDRPNQGVF
jgi:hypothetical protein